MKNAMLSFVTVVALSASLPHAVQNGATQGKAVQVGPGQAQTELLAPTVQFVSVEPGVKLEVLDWGGSGTPLIFLAGAGDTAHAFDNFAPQFTRHHHVYGITRREQVHRAIQRRQTATTQRTTWATTFSR